MFHLELLPVWLFTEEAGAWAEEPSKLRERSKYHGRSFGQSQASG